MEPVCCIGAPDAPWWHGGRYDYVELQIDFAIDLFPFYPPLVKVVRPRFRDSMMQRVTSLETLKLSHWNPVRNMGEVITRIKDMLQDWARYAFSSDPWPSPPLLVEKSSSIRAS